MASPSGNDTPYSPVPGIDPFSLDTRFRSYQTGAYLQASKQVASRLKVTLGGRVDHYDILSQARFSPRAGVSVRLLDTLSWNSSAGSYYQQPAFLFVSAFPQNSALVPWRADHYVTGLAWSPGPQLRVTAEAYRKTYTDYPVASDLPTVSLANIGDTFDVREILFPLDERRRRATPQGVELFVEKRLTSKLYGQGNLSFSRTRHAGLDTVLRPGSFDYPFVFNLLGGYRLSPAWELSARLSVLSGRPFTPVRSGHVDGPAPRRLRPQARQRRASARLWSRRHPRRPHLHRRRAAAQPVRWRAERDQPPQFRQLQLEPPHQHPAVRRAARYLPDPRVRLAVLGDVPPTVTRGRPARSGTNVTGTMAALIGLGTALTVLTLVWLFSVRAQDASIADVCWGLGFVLLAWLYCLLSPALTVRSWLVAALVTLWGARLAVHISRRRHGMAVSTPAGWLTVLSPALMTFLLMRVSGVTLLEPSLTLTDGLFRLSISWTIALVVFSVVVRRVTPERHEPRYCVTGAR